MLAGETRRGAIFDCQALRQPHYVRVEKAPVASTRTERAAPGFIKTGISPVLSYSHGLLFKVLKFKSGARASAPALARLALLCHPLLICEISRVCRTRPLALVYERCHKIAKEQSRRREKKRKKKEKSRALSRVG